MNKNMLDGDIPNEFLLLTIEAKNDCNYFGNHS